MCGRIARAHTPEELALITGVEQGIAELDDIAPSYNVPPSALLPALEVNSGQCTWTRLTWGIDPPWKGRAVINARSETLHAKRFFRGMHRCVIPATAYYEWKRRGQPWCIRPPDQRPLFLAGIQRRGECVILTRAAREDIAPIHDRMPVAMPIEMLSAWLEDDEAAVWVYEAALTLPLQSYRVAAAVGNVRYNSPECLEPINGLP